MTGWILGIVFAAVFVAVIVAIGTAGPKARAREEHRKRYQLEESGERIELAPEPGEHASSGTIQEIDAPPPGGSEHGTTFRAIGPGGAPVIETQEPRPMRKSLGRMVTTPDGEMILTTPPFGLRETLFTRRSGRYVQALYRRLPPWVVVCPKVRLDALLVPTPPDGRDADDWRTWRHRVRMRSVDFVLCDRRTWKPLLAVLIDGAPGAAPEPTQAAGSAPGGRPGEALKIGGGKDRIIDEVLGAAGLPLIRGSGHFLQDWAMIRPYVEMAILPAPSEADISDEARRARPNGAVALLRMDEHKGWLLE